MPEGITEPSEVLWIESRRYDPLYIDTTTGRLAATWQFTNVQPSQQASGDYDVGVGFPQRYVDVVYEPEQDGGILGSLGELVCLLFPMFFIALIITLMVARLRREATLRTA